MKLQLSRQMADIFLLKVHEPLNPLNGVTFLWDNFKIPHGK